MGVLNISRFREFAPILFIGLAIVTPISGMVYSKCHLARTLRNYGVPYHELSDWVCIAEHESRFNTKAINTVNYDGSHDWGIFQINDRYWCQPSDGRHSANACRLHCTSLLDNDIRNTVNCARMIKNIHGMSAWVAWSQRCQGWKPSVDECFR